MSKFDVSFSYWGCIISIILWSFVIAIGATNNLPLILIIGILMEIITIILATIYSWQVHIRIHGKDCPICRQNND